MKTHNFKLSACAISAAALLSACGGGGTTPDTTAPTVTIEDNVSAASMTSGDVTFTFNFSEAVTEFVTDDVTVTGGTKGAFNMASTGLSATLVVTPTANASGTIEVAVAATKFKDAAGNNNTAPASGTQAFNTTTTNPNPPSTANIASFDESSPPAITPFGGATGVIEAPTSGGSGNALKVTRDGGEVYAGAWLAIPTIPSNAGTQIVSARVYSPTAGIPIVAKAEFGENTGTGDVQATETVVVGWQTLTWRYTNLDATKTYNRFVILPQLGTRGSGQTFYFDEISVAAAPSSGGGSSGGGSSGGGSSSSGPSAAAPTPTALAANVSSVFSDAYTSVSGVSWGPDWGPSSARISDATLAGTKFIDLTAGKVFAGISYTANPIDATNRTHFNMHYWIDTPVPAGQVINVKLSNHAAGAGETSAIEMPTLTSVTGGSWQTISVPLSSFAIAGGGSASRNKIAEVIITATRTDGNQPVKVYFDNIYFSTNP